MTETIPLVTLRSFGGRVMLVTEHGGAKVIIAPTRGGRLQTRDPKLGMLRDITEYDPALAPFLNAINSHDELVAALQRADDLITAVHRAFGAPGDFGYETKEGEALFALYRFQPELQALRDRSKEDA